MSICSNVGKRIRATVNSIYRVLTFFFYLSQNKVRILKEIKVRTFLFEWLL